MLRRVLSGTAEFETMLAQLVGRGEADFSATEPAVREILAAVRVDGDAAVQRYVAQFERRRPERLHRDDYGGAQALTRLSPTAREALECAAGRIRRFHEMERAQGEHTWTSSEEGVTLGLRVRPLDRVGVYAPGGKARYPSSVLMSAIPARVAGVREIVLATPLAGDEADDALLAAAYLSGVDAVYDAGGAQAIGAMAYGTASLRRVDKIVGPGNAFVACAKRLVFGPVAIDSIAGPSEILVFADDTADPRVVAADLLSQAEHDEDAYPILICRSESFAAATEVELTRQIADLPRVAIARASVERHGVAFVVDGEERAIAIADAIGPEHLSVHVSGSDVDAVASRFRHAGAIFVGGLTPEAAGDYLAGPSHVLPTGGAVRYGSPLGIHDFLARTSLIHYSASALARDASVITTLARLEGLEAHARAVEVRVDRSSAGAVE